MDFETLALLFAIAVFAGIVDAIAGGGGLITLPALLVVGLPPTQALATNKIQALASVASSAVRFVRAGYIDNSAIRPKVVVALFGAGIGAVAVRLADPDLLRKIAPVILIGVALFFLFSRNSIRRQPKWPVSERWLKWVAVLPISFYDGFFGPGTGAIYVALWYCYHSARCRRRPPRPKY